MFSEVEELSENMLLQDIRNAEGTIREVLENLSKKHKLYSFDMASTKDIYKRFGVNEETIYLVDISCHLKKD